MSGARAPGGASTAAEIDGSLPPGAGQGPPPPARLSRSAGGWLVVRGTVERGDGRGRALGFRTANLDVAGLELPHRVWAGHCWRADGSVHLAAVSVGVRSTFHGWDGAAVLEAHLLDFEGDLYGEEITVTLAEVLRPQRAFADAEALVAQVAEDIAATRRWALLGPR